MWWEAMGDEKTAYPWPIMVDQWLADGKQMVWITVPTEQLKTECGHW